MIDIHLNTSLSGTIKKGLSNYRNCQTLDICGAGGENRTRTGLPPVDFESKHYKYIKPMISVSNMILLAFFVPKLLGNVRNFQDF